MGDDEIYQPSFFAPDYRAFSRREPKQRKGESLLSFAVRWNTWNRQKQAPLTPEEREESTRRNMEWRARVYESTAQFCESIIDGARYADVPGAVFFYFDGTAEKFGVNAQYVTEATLRYLKKRLQIVDGG